MVVKMMRWRPWPPLPSTKFQVRLLIAGMRGIRQEEEGVGRVVTEVRWKGPKVALSSLRRSVKRNCTKEADVVKVVAAVVAEREGEEGVEVAAGDGKAAGFVGAVEWNEEFQSVCTLTSHRDGAFHPWEVSFLVFNGLNHRPKNKLSILGTASLNLAEFASDSGKEITESIPLSLAGATIEPPVYLHLSVSLLELRTAQGSSDVTQRTVVPAPLSPSNGIILCNESSDKDEVSALKAGLRKVKILTDFVSTRKSKKTCREDENSEGRCSSRSEDAEYTYPFDTDSIDDELDEGELDNSKDGSNTRKSFSYGTLASANYLGGSFYSETKMNGEYEDWVYYSHRRSDVGCPKAEEPTSSIIDQSSLQTSKRSMSILPWRKRKLSFRSPKPKGEPLLNKDYGEEGGDDIDFDRRQMSSSDESLGRQMVDEEAAVNSSSISDFGDDNFAVGSWEMKEVVSRDGHMKICSKVFFASIDQRSERAAGESACTALVAVIADWFQSNPEMMPVKSQFDSLIRDGSLEWRNLCKNDMYMECFPDKHFDLETVLQAKIRPLSVVPRKSFIGFFHPEGDSNDNKGFDFLQGAMSFDSIWDEVSQSGSDGKSHLYIVSWNDHFFALKVDPDAYYIIDTLGERLYEGCNQAYILKFDENTLIQKMPSEEKATTGESAESGNQQAQQNTGKDESLGDGAQCDGEMENKNVVCRGKASCKEYIKSFLAAIPIRELQADIKKGLMASTPLHQRLQIEFHYTEPSKQIVEAPPQLTEPITELLEPVEPVGALH